MVEEIKIISWNICRKPEAWRVLAASDADLCLLQEAREPELYIREDIEIDDAPWRTAGMVDRNWRTAIARLSDRVRIHPYTMATIDTADSGEIAVSRLGTLTIADVEVVSTGETITVASMYGAWEYPIGSNGDSKHAYADASVHRVLSDLSVIFKLPLKRKVIAAGDLNIYYGYGDKPTEYWKPRYDSVFQRIEAIGLHFVGPQTPIGGNQANSRPILLPLDSKNVPTQRWKQPNPDTGQHQLDYVFATSPLVDRIKVHALNGDEDWGPSDHCRIEINLQI
jgi:exonuclease III